MAGLARSQERRVTRPPRIVGPVSTHSLSTTILHPSTWIWKLLHWVPTCWVSIKNNDFDEPHVSYQAAGQIKLYILHHPTSPEAVPRSRTRMKMGGVKCIKRGGTRIRSLWKRVPLCLGTPRVGRSTAIALATQTTSQRGELLCKKARMQRLDLSAFTGVTASTITAAVPIFRVLVPRRSRQWAGRLTLDECRERQNRRSIGECLGRIGK